MSLDVKDMIKLMKACRANGVYELKIGDTVMKFGGEESPKQVDQTHETVTVPTPEQLREAEELVNIQENIDATEEELSLLQVEDPQQLEQLLIQRELESGGSEARHQIAED